MSNKTIGQLLVQKIRENYPNAQVSPTIIGILRLPKENEYCVLGATLRFFLKESCHFFPNNWMTALELERKFGNRFYINSLELQDIINLNDGGEIEKAWDRLSQVFDNLKEADKVHLTEFLNS